MFSKILENALILTSLWALWVHEPAVAAACIAYACYLRLDRPSVPKPERWWRDPVTGTRATFPFPGAMPEPAAHNQEGQHDR